MSLKKTVSPVAITEKISIKDIQKKNRIEAYHFTNLNKSERKKAREGRRHKIIARQKTINKWQQQIRINQ